MILLAPAKTEGKRGHSSINTQRKAIIFIRLLPPTTLLPRGKTLSHLSLINILEKFKDFSITTRKHSNTFPLAELSSPQIISARKYSDFFACRIVLAANHQYPGNIQRLSGQQKQSTAATSSSNQQQQSTAAISSSNQQQQSTAAISSSNQQQQLAAATSSGNHQQQPATTISSSDQQQQPAAATSSSSQQQQSAAATSNSNQQQQSAFILPAAPTQSTPTIVSYYYGS